MNAEQGISNIEIKRQRYYAPVLQHSIFILLFMAMPLHAEHVASPTGVNQTLANAFANLVENAIPRDYEKRKDWGKTKNITVGIRADGLKLARRKKSVKHGVWKHYKVHLVEPEKNFTVSIDNLRALDAGKIAFTLRISAKLDTWARAKIYQYGIHLIALEMLGDTVMNLALDCEVGVRLETETGKSGVTIDPRVVGARLGLTDFHLRRVSNAKGPIIQELSDELQKAIEHELKEPKLVAKLNRAIDKKRDRLSFSLDDLIDTSWWPLASLPVVERAQATRH